LLTDGSKNGSGRKKESLKITLKRNQDGYPILLSQDKIDGHGLEYKKKLIGRFMGDIYGS